MCCFTNAKIFVDNPHSGIKSHAQLQTRLRVQCWACSTVYTVLARTVEEILTWCAMIGLRHRRQMVGVAKPKIFHRFLLQSIGRE